MRKKVLIHIALSESEINLAIVHNKCVALSKFFALMYLSIIVNSDFLSRCVSFAYYKP